MKVAIRKFLLPPAMLLSSLAPALAQLPATGVELPVNYNTFQPPAVGGTYADPVFGSTVKRISNALATANADGGGNLTWVENEYSTMSPFNSDNSRILLVHQSYFALYDGAGSYMRDLPLEIGASSEPRWSRQDNHTVYYVHGNQLKTYDISSGAMSVVHAFGEYSAISGMGESDISLDGDHLVFAGDNRYVFEYQISTGTKSPVFDTAGHPLDSVYITSRNNVIVSWISSGTGRYTGQELFDSNMNFLRQVGRADGHKDVTLDTNGDEVLVWTNSNDPQPICNNGVVKIRLSDGNETCLATFDWSLAVHISAPDNAGVVYVETYAPANPSPSSGWVPYTNELLQIKLDGSQVLRLAHHRSRPYQTNTYNWQPKISTSRDGSRVVYSSDYDLQSIDGYPDQYSDVYLIVAGGSAVSTPPAPPPPAAPPPTPAGSLVRYEQDNPAVRPTGNWFPNHGTFNSGGSAVLAMDQGSQAQFTFSGTAVQWIGYRDQWSGIAQVYLDGSLKASVDTYSAGAQAQAVVYSISGLSAGSHTLTILVTGTSNPSSGGAWVWLDAFDVPVSAVPTAPPAVVGASTSGPLTVTYNAPGGYQTLDVVNILVNTVLDGRQACYLAYSRPANALYIVPDSGDASQAAGKAMDGTGTAGNTQCTVTLAGSSATGSGNMLTLALNVSFAPSFAGNKVIYAAARDTAQNNSGWQTVGVRAIPAMAVTFPSPLAVSPPSSNSLTQSIILTYQDQSDATNLQTVWALINRSIDGREACYIAYYRPGNVLYLYPDNGDGTQAASIPLTGSNIVSNSQCSVSAQGASVSASGNRLTLTLPVTFKTAFAGFKGVWLAAQTLQGQTSQWQALGVRSIPAN